MIFQKNLQFGDIWSRNCQKNCPNWGFWLFFWLCIPSFPWCLVVFLEFTGSVNVFLLFQKMIYYFPISFRSYNGIIQFFTHLNNIFIFCSWNILLTFIYFDNYLFKVRLSLTIFVICFGFLWHQSSRADPCNCILLFCLE